MNKEQYIQAKLGERIAELEIKLHETEFEKLAFAQRLNELQKELEELKANAEKEETIENTEDTNE